MGNKTTQNARAVSKLDELSDGNFQEVLDDPLKPKKAKRLAFCSGKIYYDLLAAREERKDLSTAIVRVEQLYPFPSVKLAAVLRAYKTAADVAWVQEEPRNRGAWFFMRDRFSEEFPEATLSYIGRPASASPATGSHSRHLREQLQVVHAAIGERRAAPRESEE